MAYAIEKTYTSFGGGISDDDFIGSEYSFLDMDGIDIRSQDRFIQAEGHFTTVGDYTLSGGATWVKETPESLFISNVSTTQRNGATISLPTPAFGCESYGNGSTQINYFFLSDRIRRMNSDGSAQVGPDIITNYPLVDYTIVLGWNVRNLLFSAGDKIYFVDGVNNVIYIAADSATQLMPGSVVKCIYSYSFESTVVVATNNGNTQIYELEFTGGSYSVVRMIEVVGYECLHAVGDGFNIFWKSLEGIHQYQGGQSIFIKKLEGESTSIGYNKMAIIATGNDIFYFGSKKPGRNNVLTKIGKNLSTETSFVTKNFIVTNVFNGYKIQQKTVNSFQRTNTLELLPLDGGIYQLKKHDLNFRFGYMFDRANYVNTDERQEVVVKIQTDTMEMGGTSPVIVGKVTDGDLVDSIGNKRHGFMVIYPQMVTEALSSIGSTTEFGYVKIIIELLAGDEYSTAPGLFRKTPKVFDFTIKANIKYD